MELPFQLNDFPLPSKCFPTLSLYKLSMIVDRDYIFTLYQMGAGAIYNYLQQIEKRIEDAEARVASAQLAQVERFSKELALTKRTLAGKTEALIRERQLNRQLLRRSGSTTIERDSHNSSLPPSLDLPWQKVPRTRSLRKWSGLKPGGQSGHQGTTLRQAAQPDQVIIHSPETCMQCGAHLQHSTPETFARRQVFDIFEGRMQVTEYRAETRRCRVCATTTKAKFPVSVRAPVQYGPGVLSRSVYLHLYQLLPVARTSETMTDLFKCRISVATIQRATRVSSAKLVKTELRIKSAIHGSAIIGVDETGLRVAGFGTYIHVARTEELTHYGIDSRRGKAAMDEIGILPQFTGVLVRDCWASYRWYEQCLHCLCNAHLLRELIFIEEVDPAQKVWASPLARLLVQIKDALAKRVPLVNVSSAISSKSPGLCVISNSSGRRKRSTRRHH